VHSTQNGGQLPKKLVNTAQLLNKYRIESATPADSPSSAKLGAMYVKFGNIRVFRVNLRIKPIFAVLNTRS
jgi:hypothetical protein